MRTRFNFCLYILGFLLLFSFSSCEKLFSDDEEKEYYVRYVAEAINIDEAKEAIHEVIVYIPYTDPDNPAKTITIVKFHCRDTFNEEYGPFHSGDELSIDVDAPNRDTFIARIYVREKSDTQYRLLDDGFNRASYKLP